jgi:hypothetical protein
VDGKEEEELVNREPSVELVSSEVVPRPPPAVLLSPAVLSFWNTS